MDTCSHMRSLLIAGANQYEEFFMGLKTLEVAFQLSVKDLRWESPFEINWPLTLNYFFWLEFNCSNVLNLRNIQEQVKETFKLYWIFWINCSRDLKNFTDSKPSASNFKKKNLSLEKTFFSQQFWKQSTMLAHWFSLVWKQSRDH